MWHVRHKMLEDSYAEIKCNDIRVTAEVIKCMGEDDNDGEIMLII